MTGWIIFGVIGWVVTFMVMICKGGNNDRMEYPAEKKVDSDKSLYVNVSIWTNEKNSKYVDGCVLKLREDGIAKPEIRGKYIFEARIVKI